MIMTMMIITPIHSKQLTLFVGGSMINADLDKMLPRSSITIGYDNTYLTKILHSC